MEVIHIECHGARGLCMWGAKHTVGGRLSTRGDYTRRLYTECHGGDYAQGGSVHRVRGGRLSTRGDYTKVIHRVP